MSEQTPAPMGHNLPAGDDLVAVLTEQSEDLIARRDELLDGVGRVPDKIEDDETSGRVADFVKQINAAINRAETRRKDEKEPYLEGGRNVDAVFKKITEPLKDAKTRLTAKITDWQRAKAAEERRRRLEAEEQARREAEEAAAKARAAQVDAQINQTSDKAIDAEMAKEEADQADADAVRAAQEADAKAAELHKTRGDFGSMASLRTFWNFEIEDYGHIPLAKLRAHLPRDAVEKAIRSYVKAGGRELKGVRIFEDTKSVVR